LRIPFVVTVHGLDVFHSGYRGGLPAHWRCQAATDVYRAAHTVLCISGKVQDILQSGAPEEIRSAIVYNGVDPVLFSPSSTTLGPNEWLDRNPAAPEILVVGNLLRSKGHELLLRALAKLRPDFPQLRCQIIGEGPERAHLESLARDLDIRKQVEFAGRQTRAQVADAMRRCSVFVLPSGNEGLGCVYLEAMSCAKPAIACRGQGIDEIMEHGKNGWLIPPNGLEELTQALSALLASPDLRARIGAAARQTILEKLTLAHQAQSLANIYRQAESEGLAHG
jgi:glycosyltransferase involved in cell wall biosynthesis